MMREISEYITEYIKGKISLMVINVKCDWNCYGFQGKGRVISNMLLYFQLLLIIVAPVIIGLPNAIITTIYGVLFWLPQKYIIDCCDDSPIQNILLALVGIFLFIFMACACVRQPVSFNCPEQMSSGKVQYTICVPEEYIESAISQELKKGSVYIDKIRKSDGRIIVIMKTPIQK